MNKLARIFIFLIVFATATQSFAQKFGIKAGLNLSTVHTRFISSKSALNFRLPSFNSITPGLHLGPTLEIPLSKIFSLETSLLASIKGFKYTLDASTSATNYGGKVVMNNLYIDLPITPKVTHGSGKIKYYVLAGPYIGVGIIGNSRRTYTEDGKTKTEDTKVIWGKNGDLNGANRLDFGLILGLGIEIKSLQFGLNYNHGIANLSSSDNDHYTITNRVLAISVGYKFGEKDNNHN